MLIFSNSMCKSASTVIWWYSQQLIYNAHKKNGREALRNMVDSGEIEGTGGFVKHPVNEAKVDRLLTLAKQHGPTVVKVHCTLDPYLQQVLEQGDAVATFCYRDPRDMILSAIDHRKRAAENGRQVFENFTTVEESIEHSKYWCRLACRWVESDLAKLFQYVETVSNPIGQIRRLADYFNLEVNDELINKITRKEENQKKVGWCEFNRGDLSRYQHEMLPHEIERCNLELGKFIRRLGFEVESTNEVVRPCKQAA